MTLVERDGVLQPVTLVDGGQGAPGMVGLWQAVIISGNFDGKMNFFIRLQIFFYYLIY